MPTYEYECKKCEHRFDKFQKMTEKPLSKCPECGGKVARIIGMGGGIIFKGPGFYTTEYRSENYKKREREDKQGIGSSTGSSSSSCSSCAPSASCSTCKKQIDIFTGLWYLMSLCIIFRRSSTVEQAAVNRKVVGSNPTAGALKFFFERQDSK